jgi:hypothetical protein
MRNIASGLQTQPHASRRRVTPDNIAITSILLVDFTGATTTASGYFP